MKEKDFKKILNIILIIGAICIIILSGIWIYQEYEQYKIEKDAQQAILEFDAEFIEDVNIVELENESIIQENSEEEVIEKNVEKSSSKVTTKKSSSVKTKTSSTTSATPQRKMYKGFPMLGYIQIPRTGIKLPMVESVSQKALNVAVGVLITPGINEPGNTIILGHNYRNKSFFSRNYKIQIGDEIFITNEYGNKLRYIVYNIYETTPEDAEYMTRETNRRNRNIIIYMYK